MDQLMTDEEMQTVIMSLAKARSDRGFTKEEAEMVLAWAHTARVDSLSLAAVLGGHLLVTIEEGDIAFVAP